MKAIPYENKFIVVVGTFAGGMKVLLTLVEQLPKDFPAPLLIVQHISADATGDALLNSLNKIGKPKCIHAKQGNRIKPDYIYFAPSDNYLMIEKDGSLFVTKGAQENRSRPAIDPLFRSAAASFGNRTIGILLTGYLDDGAARLTAIQRCGGITITQDPADADYPDMPTNALNKMKPDYCVPIAEMGGILSTIMIRKIPKQLTIPKDIVKEVKIAQLKLSDLPSVNSLRQQVPFNCPGCGGVLCKMDKGLRLRYRCHTGHPYAAATLLAEQTEKIEETMWTELRMFEERKNLHTTIANGQKGAMANSANESKNVTGSHR